MSDLTITCRDCNTPFTITEGEQKFYANLKDAEGKSYSLPRRCKECRQKRKAANGGAPAAPRYTPAPPMEVESQGRDRRDGGRGRGRRDRRNDDRW